MNTNNVSGTGLPVGVTSQQYGRGVSPHHESSPALQVGDDTTGNAHNVSRSRTEVVVPRSRSSPHLVVLQQVRVHEHTQLYAVTKGRYAAFVFGNPKDGDEDLA